MFDFNQKSVLVTGRSRGLGRALAQRLAAEGGKIVLVARSSADLDQAVSEIRNSGGIAFGVAADVGDKKSIYSIDRLPDYLTHEFGDLCLIL
jgi:NAD(P)-dependent dehydrogenase (short-subunit alcohol dehydrogenase family)